MERKTRLELTDLSLELLGSKSAWKKIVDKGVSAPTSEKDNKGRPILTMHYMTADQLLENLRDLKKQKEESKMLEKVQQAAGDIVK